MNTFFFLLLVLSLGCLILGIIKPSFVIRWGLEEKRTRKRVLKYFGIGFIVFLILFSATIDNPEVEKYKTSTDTKHTFSNNEEIAVTLDKKIAALGDINLISLDKSEDIKELRGEYENLTSEQKILVTKLSLLTEAENKINGLKTSADVEKSLQVSKEADAEKDSAVAKEAVPQSTVQEAPAESQKTEDIVKEGSTQSQNNELTVYITKTGSKYHRDGCRYLRQSKISISKSEAINQGYTPCSVCNP
ncbi:hypothetical protein [Anaerovorax odorimutans]|uniref:hypothetical protein n=1 Tax=Anaerovorax odorimutans TaxID=109327 RepID=UPI0003FA82BE|nr:hypothetical protein [Anaerovorax odorimutans]